MLGLVDCFKIKTSKMFHVLENELKNHYDIKKITRHKHYLYAEGNIPIMLVAHIDTVHKTSPHEVFWDKKQNVLWSPTGLGADDRAGVWAILQLLKHKPYVLFCDEEETGGKGAIQASKDLWPNVHFIIELDRKGKNDAVFYDCDNEEFTDFICEFGFKESIGSFSDISFLCPSWGIAGVNLSIGYYRQHTDLETLYLNETIDTINKVAKILQSDTKEFQYIDAYRSNIMGALKKSRYSFNDSLDFSCSVCGKIKSYMDMSDYETVCNDCARPYYVCCDYCGHYVSETMLIDCSYGKGEVCDDCFESLRIEMDTDEELFASFKILRGGEN